MPAAGRSGAFIDSAPALIRASVVEVDPKGWTGAKHGPYYHLTQCLAPGKVRKFLLKTDPAVQRARRATAAFNEFYDGLEELSQINTELLYRGEALDPDDPTA